MKNEDWPRAIEHARRLLEAAPNAPAWLREAVSASVKFAAGLAPDSQRDHKPADHFYPH